MYIFSGESTAKVTAKRSTGHQTTNKKSDPLFLTPISFTLENDWIKKNEVECTRKADTTETELPAAGKKRGAIF